MKKQLYNLLVIIVIIIIIIFTVICINKICLKVIEKGQEKVNITKNNGIIEQEKLSKKLSLVMVGDCLIHRFVYTDAYLGNDSYSFSKMFTEVKPLIENHDLAYYNQESNIGGKELGLSAYPRFNSPEEIGNDMLDLGFNLISLANNHTMDKGELGVINSVNYWKSKSNIYYSGQALSEEDRINNIKVLSKNGIKYAFLSYTTVTNGLVPPNNKEFLTNIYSYDKAKKDIERIKDEADIIIVAMHWGEEYTTKPNENQKKVAKELSELGVNLIIGNHAHSIQSVEMINDTLVFYALGNFIAAQDTKDKQTGVIVELNIIKNPDGKIVFDNIKANLIYTYFKGSRDFKIYPFSSLDSSILPNHEYYYNKYKNLLMESNIVEVK